MATNAPCALELRDLRKSFGKTEIIRGVNLAVQPGERVAIIGPNGAGKSTLFNLISGRFGPTSGEVLLNGQRIDGKAPYEINRMGLSRSFQITNIFPKLSVFENLRCGVLWSRGYKYTFLRFLSNLDDANERAKIASRARKAATAPMLARQREAARATVAEFVQKWLMTQTDWKPHAGQKVEVLFADEPIDALDATCGGRPGCAAERLNAAGL